MDLSHPPDRDIELLVWGEDHTLVNRMLQCPLLELQCHCRSPYTLDLLDNGGRVLHICALLSAALGRGTLCGALLLFLLCLLRLCTCCHVSGAKDHFCTGGLPFCLPAHPHSALLQNSSGPIQEHAHIDLGRWPGGSGEGPV